MRRFFTVVFLFLLGVILVAYGVANRHDATFIWDPFIDEKFAPTIQAPLSVFLALALFIGVIVGWLAAWVGQGHWRRSARETHKEATIWKREAENLKRGLEAATPKAATPPAPRPLRSFF
jgi:uncharacterized integral membrane protein